LAAAFLSNEAGILDSVRFENSAAYLASWIQKLENDPRMIVSAASQAQRSRDFIIGIEHKESLQECQVSPEGMPLTWAREHGIDTRIPSFAPLGFARPFIPSSPYRPDTQLRAERIGCWTSRATCQAPRTTHALHVALCPRTARGAYVGCSTARTPASGHKDQMKYLRSCFEQENKRWTRILASSQKLEEHLCKRLDCDKIIFAPRLNHSRINALRSTQTADAIRLQQVDRAIRNLEASIAAKCQFLARKRSAQFVCRLLEKRKPKARG
jgi:hypothetical protein